ncbi:MAG: methyltransferase domain-containing protein [Bacteroidetes bacterium]|nr:methyltransferase domain-containing protein [Bacteroidota bacterium]
MNKKVLEVGSQDINGNNNYLFENCDMLRVDLGAGPNVDLVCHGADLNHEDSSYDVIISTEAFEHDSRFEETLKNIIRLLKPSGFFVFTCASAGRGEHGTHNFSGGCSPHTLDFYENRTEEDVRNILNLDEIFNQYEFKEDLTSHDLYFYGIKK